MSKNLILCSTGCFIGRRNNYDHSLIAKLKPELGFHGFEIFMFNQRADQPDAYESDAREVIRAKEQGAHFYSMHMNKWIGELISRNEGDDLETALKLFEADCRYAVRYGVTLLVLHLWGGLPSDKQIHVNIGMFPELKQIADRYGLLLTVENIVCNTHKPLDHMKRLWELYPNDIRFTIDVRQAEFHKSLIETCESSFLWDNQLVSHLHISDYHGGHMDWDSLRITPVLGSGDVDFAYLFSFLKDHGYGGSITFEYNFTQESDGLQAMLNDAYEFIASGMRSQ